MEKAKLIIEWHGKQNYFLSEPPFIPGVKHIWVEQGGARICLDGLIVTGSVYYDASFGLSFEMLVDHLEMV